MRKILSEKYITLKWMTRYIPYIVFVLLMVVVISLKINYHVDELYSYGLSNNQGGVNMEITDGFKYESTEVPFLNFLIVNPDERYDYRNVWENQKNDVHPPLYYMILHTICSFFPSQFSKWFAGIINIIFALLTLSLFRKLLNYFCESVFIKEIISIGFVISAGILSSISFFRMYIMAMFWVTAICYLYISKIDSTMSMEFYLRVFFVITLGALTHYYCIVYFVLITITLNLYLLWKKHTIDVIRLSITSLCAGCAAFALFPPMINHIFFGYRGTESINNLLNVSDYFHRIHCFYGFINHQLFGGLLTIGLVACALLLVFLSCFSFSQTNAEDPGVFKIMHIRYLLIIIPTSIYFFVVSKIAVFITDRYIFPIYSITYLVGITFIMNVITRLVSKRLMAVIAITIVTVISFESYCHASFDYLFLDSKVFLDKTAKYADYDCLCIYDKTWEVPPMFLEAQNYHSITFVNKDNSELIDLLIEENYKPIILTVVGIDNKEQYADMYVNKSVYFNSYDEIGSYSFGTSYQLNRNY